MEGPLVNGGVNLDMPNSRAAARICTVTNSCAFEITVETHTHTKTHTYTHTNKHSDKNSLGR